MLVLALLFAACSVIGYFRNAGHTESTDPDALTVRFFDVGQADCSLLTFPDGMTVLIDAGNTADGKLIAAKLLKLGIKKIDHFILTHPHEDHIGGAAEVLRKLTVENAYLPDIDEGSVPDTNVYNKLRASLKNEGCETFFCRGDRVIAKGENYGLTVLAPTENAIFSSLNDYSLVIRAEYDSVSLLFAGDAGKASALEMIRSKALLDSDILKVAHHGGSDGSCREFINAVKPTVAVISCGKGNEYGHPHDETLKTLSDVNAKYYRTDQCGTVTMVIKGDSYTVTTDKNTRLDGNVK